MKDFEVTITEVCLVSPAIPTERHHVPATTFDLMQKRDCMPYLQRVAFYPSTGEDSELLIANMKKSLAEVLVHFYPFAGRLKFTKGGKPEIDCNDCGAELSVAVTDASLKDIDHSQYSPLFPKLIQRGNYEETTMSGTAPIVAFQVTKFNCGAVSVAWSFDHLVVDGVAMMHFLTSWMEVTRGKSMSVLPNHDRLFEENNKELASKMDNVASTFRYKFVDPTIGLVSRIFPFDEEEIEKLRLMAFKGCCKESFSTYEVVVAHLWVVLCKARDLPQSQRTRAQLAVNCRHRIVPPVPPEYFGNVVLPGVADSTVGQIQAGGNFGAAILLQKTIRSFGMDEIRSQLSSYNDNTQQNNPMSVAITDGIDIFVGSSHRHPLYEIDFGWGKPVAVRHARFLWDGFCFLDPSPKGGKSMDIAVHLPPKIMEKFAALIKNFDEA